MRQLLQKLITDIESLTPGYLSVLETMVAEGVGIDAQVLESAIVKLRFAVVKGQRRAAHPGARLDQYGRPIVCSGCGRTKKLHYDFGSGGPYRCNSPSCVMY